MSDSTVILMGIAIVLIWVSVILFVIWMFKRSLGRMFMVDELTKYGGTISYNGVTFTVRPGAEFVHVMGGVEVINPGGVSARFPIGNAFTPRPVIMVNFSRNEERETNDSLERHRESMERLSK